MQEAICYKIYKGNCTVPCNGAVTYAGGKWGTLLAYVIFLKCWTSQANHLITDEPNWPDVGPAQPSIVPKWLSLPSNIFNLHGDDEGPSGGLEGVSA